MIALAVILLFLTALSATLTALLVRWIWPHSPERQVAFLAAAPLPFLMIGFGAALLIRDWNVDTGGREIQTAGFGVGQFLTLISIITFVIGMMIAKLCLKLFRRT